MAKRTQIKHLMERNQELEKMWMETRDRIKVDTLELVNYRELLTPEYDRKMNIRASAVFKKNKHFRQSCELLRFMTLKFLS